MFDLKKENPLCLGVDAKKRNPKLLKKLFSKSPMSVVKKLGSLNEDHPLRIIGVKYDLGTMVICTKMLRDGVQAAKNDGTQGYPIVHEGEKGVVFKNVAEGTDYVYGIRMLDHTSISLKQTHLDNFFQVLTTYRDRRDGR